VHANGVYRGPYAVDPAANTALVIGTTYDPATPYQWAQRLTAQLGNAELVTMIGDGHTAFGGNSRCIDDAVVTYIETVTLPPDGTVCRQDITFPSSPATSVKEAVNVEPIGAVPQFP